MKSSQRKSKKYYTVEQANAMLPLLTRILQDITTLAQDLRQRHERLTHLQNSGKATDLAMARRSEKMVADFEPQPGRRCTSSRKN